MKTQGKVYVSGSLAEQNCTHLRNYINSLHFLTISYTQVITSSVFDSCMKQNVIIWSSTWKAQDGAVAQTIVFEAPDEYKNRQPRVLFDGL